MRLVYRLVKPVPRPLPVLRVLVRPTNISLDNVKPARNGLRTVQPVPPITVVLRVLRDISKNKNYHEVSFIIIFV